MTKKEYYKLNAARCLRCETTLVATTKYEIHTCGCENLIVTGDRYANNLLRYTKDKRYIQELSLYDTGHPISIGHAYYKPQSALDPLRSGGWFVQSLLHGKMGGRYRYLLDDYGQACEIDEIEIGNDGCPWTKAIFRFLPVCGLRLERYGDISPKSIAFHIEMLSIAGKFINTAQKKSDLIEVLLELDFQDRSGIENNGRWR